MKLQIYSDLHLEFGNRLQAPVDSDADILILAGDIITFKPKGFERLKEFIKDWKKPVLFVAGNHEFYTNECSIECGRNFLNFLKENQDVFNQFYWLDNLEYSTPDVVFFGGTMWTDFNKANPIDMNLARTAMIDYYQIRRYKSFKLRPEDTVKMHQEYKDNLISWLEINRGKKCVVISHHAPCLNPNSNHKGSLLQPAFNSLDMIEIIEKYQPDLWIYGHTHECDDQMIGKTRIVSNQFGYYNREEVKGFDLVGMLIEI